MRTDGGQLINMGIGRGFVFSVVSQKTAARYAVDRSKLQTPIMLDGPSGEQTRATELCTVAFPQEKAVGGKMKTPDEGLQRWQMQMMTDICSGYGFRSQGIAHITS
jgi:hypothetical protein